MIFLFGALLTASLSSISLLTTLSEVPNAKGETSLNSEIRQIEVKVIMNSNEMMGRVFCYKRNVNQFWV